MGDFNIDVTNLYNAISTGKIVESELNELLNSVSDIKVTVDNDVISSSLEDAKKNINSIINNTVKDINDRLEKIKTVLFEMDPNAELLFLMLSDNFSDDFGNILDNFDEIDKEQLLSVFLMRMSQQNDIFELVEEYDNVLENYTELLKKYEAELSELEKNRAADLSAFPGNNSPYNNKAFSDWSSQVTDKWGAKIAEKQEQYNTLYQALSLLKTARDYAEDYGYNQYLSYEDFDTKLKDSSGSRIADCKFVYDTSTYAAGDGEYIFYDKNGKVIEVSDLEKALFIRNNDKSGIPAIDNTKYKDVFKYLTEDEIKIATYLFNTGNTEKLEQYFRLKENHAAQREGQEKAEKVIEKIEAIEKISPNDDWAYKKTIEILAAEGFVDGLGNFADGIYNLFAADGKVSANQYKTSFLVQALQEKYEDEKIMKIFSTGTYEISNSIGNMAPSMAIGLVTGCPLAGSIIMGASAAGNSREQGLQSGMTETQAWMYGVLSGTSEATLGYFLGKIPGLSKMDDIVKLPGWKGFISNLGSEGLEEATQTIVDSFLSAAITREEVEINWQEVVKSGIYGIITAGITNGGQILIGGAAYTINNMSQSEIESLVTKYEKENLNDPKVIENLKNDLDTNSKNNDNKEVNSTTEQVKATGLSLFDNSDTKTNKVETKNNKSNQTRTTSTFNPQTSKQNVVNDSINTTNNTIKNNNIKVNFEQEIFNANYYNNKGNTYRIKVNSLAEIPSSLWSQIKYPSLIDFDVNGKIVSYANAKPSSLTGINIDNKSTNSEINWEAEITAANNQARNGGFYTIDINNFAEIPNNLWSQINDSSLLYFRVNGTVIDYQSVYNQVKSINSSNVNSNNKITNNNSKTTKVDNDNSSELFKNLVSKLGINQAMKAVWYVAYANNYNYIPSEFRTQMEQISLIEAESFLEKHNNFIEQDIKDNELYEIEHSNRTFDPTIERFNNAKVYTNDSDIAIKFGDIKQLLFFELEKLKDMVKDPNLKNEYERIKRIPNNQKDIADLFNLVAPYLNDDYLKTIQDIYITNINNDKLTENQKTEIYLYSKIFGPILSAYERKTDTIFTTKKGEKTTYYGSNKETIQRTYNKARIRYGSEQKNIDQGVKEIDKILKIFPPLQQDTILYRGVNSLFFNGTQLNITDLKVGDLINDKATISTSFIGNKAYANLDIILEILAPAGTNGAYIEPYVAGYSQQEYLLPRNTTFKVISEPTIDSTTGKTKIKVEIVPNPNLKQKITNIIGKIKINEPSKTNSNIIEKLNIKKVLSNPNKNLYNNLFNKFDFGIDINDFINKLKQNGLLDRFDKEVENIDYLYRYKAGPGVIEHGIEHVECVMLYSMYMGKELGVNENEMNLLIDAAKYHDTGVFVGHHNHAIFSAQEAIIGLKNVKSPEYINKVAAIIECHAIDDNIENYEKILKKYNIQSSEYKSILNVLSILKDADALDRTRFQNNLDLNKIRNKGIAYKLVKTSYQFQEIRGIINLEEKISSKKYTPEEIQKIRYYQSQGIPNYIIEHSFKTYFKWGDNRTGRRYYNSPEDMIKYWLGRR